VSKDFITFLGEMQAAFKRLQVPVRSQASTEVATEEPPDLGSGIMLEPRLLRNSEPGLSGVAVIVQTSLGRKDHVGPHNNNHYWTARSGLNNAWVYPKNGKGKIWPPGGNAINVDHPHPGYLPAVARVTVASKDGMTYYFDGSFDGPKH
jgi:hypothetical protein